MKYNFDEVIDRKGTHAVKVERLPKGADKDSLSLWIADMDFACAEPILKALHERIDRKIFGYTMYDADECMDAVTGWMKKRYGWNESRENLFFCPGVVAAYAALINLLTEPGDGIVLQRPIYYPFTNKANSNGRIPVDNALIYENGAYRIDFEDLDRKMADPANKVLVVCSPHNPTGRVWTEDELKKTVEICKKYDKWIICDEIHCDLIRRGVTFTPIMNVAPEYADRIVVCTAPSKTFNLAGLQVSNIFIPDDALRRKFEQAVAASGYSQLNTMGLVACEAAYRYGEEWYDAVKAYIRENLTYAQHFLEEQIPQVKAVKPEGTYLLWVDFRSLGLSRKELEELIVKKAGLWLDSGDIFGAAGRGFERINVACPRSVLTEALERLARVVREKEPIVCK
mgnify:CR=1 FL=1